MIARCVSEPAPAEAMLSAPGRCFSRAITSWIDFTEDPEAVTISSGDDAISTTGIRSDALYGSFGYRAGDRS
jgi:hypothetical protein